MKTAKQDSTVRAFPAAEAPMALDEAALDAARRKVADGAMTPSYGPCLLNDALATELVCVLRYKRHYFTAHGITSPHVAAEFLEHANAEAAHGDRLAARIAQLGRPRAACSRTSSSTKKNTPTNSPTCSTSEALSRPVPRQPQGEPAC